METAEHLLSSEQLIRMFVDIVSKNGNLLINVGPRADGTLPENQLKPLKDLGKWLKLNGEGIYDSRPWIKYGQVLDDKTELRFTRKANVLYVYFLSVPKNKTITLTGCTLANGAKAYLVGEKEKELRLISLTDKVQIQLPDKLPDTGTFLVKLSGLKE
jgi:alpha-L-fucosidase